MKKVFSWRNYVRTVAGEFTKFSDFVSFINEEYDDIKHLVKKDSTYVADYKDGMYDDEDYYNVVEETTPARLPQEPVEDKKEKLNAILDMLKDLI